MAKSTKRKIKLKNGGVVPLIRLGIIALSVMFVFSTISFLVQRQSIMDKKSELLSKIEEQKKLTVLYEEELSRVGTKEYYEYMARKNLGYIYPDEHIMIVTDKNSAEE